MRRNCVPTLADIKCLYTKCVVSTEGQMNDFVLLLRFIMMQKGEILNLNYSRQPSNMTP